MIILFMQKLQKLIKTIFPYLILTTLFSIPFQIRKVLFPVFENGYFHETMSMSIYLTDILIFLCITCGLVVYFGELANYITKKYKDVKIRFSKRDLPSPLSLAGESPQAEGEKRTNIYKNPLFWLSLFILWQCATLFRTANIGITVFRTFKIIEMTLFGVVLYLFLSNISSSPSFKVENQHLISNIFSICKNIKKQCYMVHVTCYMIIFSGTLQSIWAIIQFLLQRSLNLRILQESILSPAAPGVAKIVINGQKHIRAYGGFPHPNILAGFLLLTITVTLLTLLSYNYYRKITLFTYDHYSKITLFLIISLFVQLAGFILAGSISALSGLILSIFIIITLFPYKHFKKLTLVCYNHYSKITLVLISFVILGIISGIVYLRSADILQNKNSIAERVEQFNTSKAIIFSDFKNAVVGIGTGNYVDYMANMDFKTYVNSSEPWKKQPVHNTFMLILTENGAAGLILFIVFLFLIIYEAPLVISLLPILFMDHYLYTMQQGMLIFAAFIVIGLLFKS